MVEIGGNFRFEKINGSKYHNTDLFLSSGRNCLRYIIRERKIKTLYIPYFLCESLSEVSLLEKVDIKYYHISNLLPNDSEISKLDNSTYLYFVNYYGILNNLISNVVEQYNYVIIDNTHDFFNTNSYNVDVIYNFRKYFGVPDGACIVSQNLHKNKKYPLGKSCNKVFEMISRDETGEFIHYKSFLDADKYFKNEDLVYISNFTKNYLSAIDYIQVLNKRNSNFNFLHSYLKQYNNLDIQNLTLTYMYPLEIARGEELRKYLIENGVYSQLLWPNVMYNGANSYEQKLAKNVVLLPIDQRYGDHEMDYICNTITKFLIKKK